MNVTMDSTYNKLDFTPLEILAASPRWIADVANELLYRIIDQLGYLLREDDTVRDPPPVSKKPVILPTPQRVMLLPRYSRSPDGVVVFYGYRNHVKHLTREMLLERYIALRSKRLADNIKKEYVFDIATGAWNPVHRDGEAESLWNRRLRSYLSSVEKQLSRVLDVWSQLAYTIEAGVYYGVNQTGAHGYCSNILDVQLVDALDRLRGLDADASALAGEDYVSVFSGTVGRSMRGCSCEVCDCIERPQAMQAFRTMALRYHAQVDYALFTRVFRGLGIKRVRA